jgi:hypothetical protein
MIYAAVAYLNHFLSTEMKRLAIEEVGYCKDKIYLQGRRPVSQQVRKKATSQIGGKTVS